MTKKRFQKRVLASQLPLTMSKLKYKLMARNKLLLTLLLVSTVYSGYSQKGDNFTKQEKTCINIFNGFTSYIKTCIKNKTEVNDSSSINYILLNFLFIDKNLDSSRISQLKENEISTEQLNNLRSELKGFYRYFQERGDKLIIENLIIIPIRLSKDTFVYNQLTTFQKENTFVFFDKRNPQATLGYVLFVPPIKGIITEPRIWSWTLLFQFGKYMFKSATGEVGSEYIFSQ
jgi:hypothetical protein